MAYLAPIDTSSAAPVRIPQPVIDAVATELPPQFSALEWSIIRLAGGDALWTIRASGPLRCFVNWLTGRRTNPALANERLEALRKIAVLSWHYGFSVSGEDVGEFLAAGFTLDQYEQLVTSVRRQIGSNVRMFATEGHA
jgi:hypothetical protein